MKQTLFFILLISVSFSVMAQENTLNSQFENITQKSNNYKDYKVVKKNRLNALHRNVLDTVAQLELKIKTTTSEIAQQNLEISSLKDELATTQNDLVISKEKEDGIAVFGLMTQKNTYNIIALSLIGFLIFVIVILFIKFKSSYSIIKNTKQKLDETEEEYENFRQRSLEREQQLRRKLQDELNKNKAN